jgi:hypothetical protein
MKNTLNRKLFKYRIKLLLCNLKTIILFVFIYLWLFSPLLIAPLLSESKLFAFICIIAFCFNFKLVKGTNKWFDKINNEKNEFQSSIIELQYLIDEERMIYKK